MTYQPFLSYFSAVYICTVGYAQDAHLNLSYVCVYYGLPFPSSSVVLGTSVTLFVSMNLTFPAAS